MAQKISEMAALPNPLDGTEKVEASQSDGGGGFNTGGVPLSDVAAYVNADAPVQSVNSETGTVVLDYGDFAGTQGILLNNEVRVQGKDSGGTARNIGFVSSFDQVIFGTTSLPARIFSSVVPNAQYGGNTYDLITTQGGQTIMGEVALNEGRLQISRSANQDFVVLNTTDAGASRSLSIAQEDNYIRFRFSGADRYSGIRFDDLDNVRHTFERGGNYTLSGNINVRDVTYTWPSANAAGVMKNNGSGTLSWGDLVANSYTTGTLPSAAANTGAVAFDSTISKHVGSDGSTWNAMY